ncbi:uncharacterized protein LOC144445424 [Glandiceps talaboti]
MDTPWYIDQCMKHLDNTNFYRQLDEDPTDLYLKQLERKIKRWEQKKWISRDLSNKLIPKEPKPGHFYGLPKIHKENTPLRPIIPQCQSLTTPLAQYVDFILQHIVHDLPSHIKDTTHHLQDVKNIAMPDTATLVTMDVISLYTNIPHEYGIKAVQEALEENNTTTPHPQLVTEMIEFILSKN